MNRPSNTPSYARGPAGSNPENGYASRGATYSKYSRSGASRFEMSKLLQPYMQRFWLILLLVAAGAGGSAIWAFRMPPVFESKSTLYVAKQQQKVLNLDGLGQGERNDDQVMLNTIVQSIRNSSVLRRVAASNQLTRDRRFTGGDTNILTDDIAAVRLGMMLNVRLRPATLLIDISLSSTNAELTAQLANSIAREFITERAERAFQSTQTGGDNLISEVKRLETKLRESERKLQAFRESNKVTTIESERQLLEQQIAKANADIATIRADYEEVATDVRLIKEAKGNVNELLAVPSIAKVPAVAAITQQVLQQQLVVAGFTNRYKPRHPKLVQAQQLLNDMQRSQSEVIETAILGVEKRAPTLKAGEAPLQAQIERLQSRMQQLNRISADYSALEREVATDTTLQQSVLKRIKELELTRQVDMVPISISEVAPVPKKPTGPNRIRIIGAGVLLGLLLGLGLAHMLQSTDSSLRTVDEAEERLQLPVLGAISIDAGSDNQEIPRIVMLDEAHSLTAEGFRSLRASTAMIGRAETIKIRLITSALPSEGKSYSAMNYAAALAQVGQRVVLMDMDLRRPTVGKRLGIPDDAPGVSSYLLGHKSANEIHQPTRVPGLSVIPAGPRIPNPAEQLAGPHTAELFKELAGLFDVVVVDTAPVNSVADTLSLLPNAQIVLMVVRAARTPERAVQRAISEIYRAGAKINGIVLNHLPKRGGYGYYYYYYSKDGYKSGGVYGAPEKNGKAKSPKPAPAAHN